ncbi:RluA family pseudouridine synthase [Patescibacteria group bacterium]|nr:RluA family pseudouridine synthase [Patescibacteria group bacterium]
MTQKWIAQEQDAKKRLDNFLTEQIPHATRSAVAKELKKGSGFVNGKKASVHMFLKPGDEVELIPQDTQTQEAKKKIEKKDKKWPKLKDIIIEKSTDWIVINKPAGLLVHPDQVHKGITLIDLILDYDPKIAKIGEDPSRPGIVHRLDKEVSGLMVIARNQKSFDFLKKQFAEHQTSKKYLLLTYNHPPLNEGEIKFRIARSKTKPRMAARPSQELEGKIAWTHYTVLQSFITASLIEAEIISGRTHQIRAHFHALSCPVIGDKLYTIKKYKNIPAPRLMLQSIKLQFNDPKNNEPMVFNLEPDPAFAKLIEEKLKKSKK